MEEMRTVFILQPSAHYELIRSDQYICIKIVTAKESGMMLIT
jgi:hypothetical protein